MRINYITNLGVDDYSGGWSGMNYHVWKQLSKNFEVNLIQNVNPRVSFPAKVLSRFRRTLGVPGAFVAFNNARLRRIKNLVEPALNRSAKFNFFHGSTPWVHVESDILSAAYLDCCFASYIKVYHNPQHFSSTQLNNLFQEESRFLKRCEAVFFSSQWALNDAKVSYRLDGSNFFVAGLGAGIETQKTDRRTHKHYFLFVGLDFFGKGGEKVVNAFNEIQNTFPDFSLKIVGERPPEKYLAGQRVQYMGKFSQSNPDEKAQLGRLFSEAFCFVLPTSKDMTPLVLIEALHAGCPVISINRFGIPEIVRHKQNGLLIDAEKQVEGQLATAMAELITNKELYDECSRNASTSVSAFTWENVGRKIVSELCHRMPEWRQ